MVAAEIDQSKETPRNARKRTPLAEKHILSPRFRSAAAMAGWDEESLLACLVVEDTPDRSTKQRKRWLSKSPITGSKRRRKSPRRSSSSVPAVVLSLDEGESAKESGVSKVKKGEGSEVSATAAEEPKVEEIETARVEKTPGKESNTVAAAAALPCMGKLREELSCAICLDICFEPSTTPCGHSFCLKCLRRAASNCGKRCPKCRDLIGNARSCTVNTVLWNTIQLLFPEEVETKRKKPTSPKQPVPPPASRAAPTSRNNGVPVPTRRSAFVLSSELVSEAEMARRTRRRRPNVEGRGRVSVSQSEDAALALRLQREEFMGERREQEALQRSPPSVLSASANLRALASRAIQARVRNWLN